MSFIQILCTLQANMTICGGLSLSIRKIDASDAPLDGISFENSRREGKAMGVKEDFYPQLLQPFFICHAPARAQIPWCMVYIKHQTFYFVEN
jgi:hypothetical protein